MNTMTATCSTPRLLLAAPQSGSGKTTLFCGILRALLDKGVRAAAFKSGPDYIDPMFHAQVVGAPSRNLDIFLTGRDNVRRLFAKTADGADLALLEGAMGFYDGMADTTDGSAYDLARTVQAPVVLILNGKGAALSLGAMIKGFREFRRDSGIQGVILNNVTKMTYQFYQKILEEETGVRLYGYFPRLEDAGLESRHLGLVTAGEVGNLESLVSRWAGQAAESIDLEGLQELARTAPPLAYEPLPLEPLGQVRIAVARDKAFCFYYQDALDLLEALGADLVPFSPLTDQHLPDCDGLYIGGGYPELYAAQLADNTGLRTELREKLADGLPCYAECGGFMYLMESFRDGDKEYPWVGAVRGHCWMTKRLVRFGYVNLTAQEDNVLCPAGGTIAAHEFHYSDSDANGASFVAVKARRALSWPCAQATRTLYAAYPHIHLWGNPEFAKNFVRACVQYQGKGGRE